jgi:phage gp36-like protein
MPYATTRDLLERFGEEEMLALSDRAGSGSLNTSVLSRAIEDASGEIDGYVGNQYELPLSTIPPVLARLCCDIARWRLQEDRPTDVARQRYEDAIAFLTKVAEGKVQLGVDGSNEQPAAASSALPRISAPGRLFSLKDPI